MPKHKRVSVREPYLLPYRPSPTPELQELYNQMRDAEEELDLKERIDLQGGLDSGTTQDNPPQSLAPSQAATMPGPPSCKSITRGFKDMEISDGTQQEKQKRKAMRHGPLDKCTKARAALMRKLGACQNCRYRRVKCTHHDWTKFETEYQTSKDPPANPPTIPSYSHQAMSSAAYSLPVQCWQPTKPQDLEMDLIGVGHNPATLAPPTVSLGWDAEQDFGLVLQSHGSYQNWPASCDDHPLSNAFGAHQPPPSTVSTLWDRCLPIGRQVSEARDEWECQWRNDGTGSLISSGGGEACPHRHLTLRELCNHYSCVHGQYRQAEEPFFWRCMDCQFDNNRPGPCPQCRQGSSSSSEKWYYGFVSTDQSLASAPYTRVAGQSEPPTAPSTGPLIYSEPRIRGLPAYGGYPTDWAPGDASSTFQQCLAGSIGSLPVPSTGQWRG